MYSFNELRKNVKKDFSGYPTVKVAILADSASQFLATALKGYGYTVKVNFEIFEADYNQIDLQIFDPGSELYTFKPDFIVINRSAEKLLKQFYKKDLSGQYSYAQDEAALTQRYYDTISAQLPAKVIINTYPEINDSVFGNFAAKTAASFTYQLRKLNLQLMELSQQAKNMFVCDLAALYSEVGYRTAFDPKMYLNGDMVYSIDFIPSIAKNITDVILSITGQFKKCLVLDLDNTLWGGIIGDDGVEGIELGHLGLGKVFTDLQLWVKQLKRRGIIIAVCSKNEENIAKGPFTEHPDMQLRLDDVAVFVANWETKVDNIRYIQSILNIGFDSMVFVDDNPFEREMVKAGIPDIMVPDMPEDPAEYMTYLRSLNIFETASFTEEDTGRTKQYQEEAERAVFFNSFENEDDFLKSLQMLSQVKPFDKFTIPRVAQLSQRSNQFNLRTVRYTEEDLKIVSISPDHYGISLTLADRFGDHGLISIIILHKQEAETLFIDSWIMSCRVLKRGMENFTMNVIMEFAASGGFKKVVGEYLPTKKNAMVKNHYANLGFAQDGDKWVMDVSSYTAKDTFITAE